VCLQLAAHLCGLPIIEKKKVVQNSLISAAGRSKFITRSIVVDAGGI
jgi:hypothetical protein